MSLYIAIAISTILFGIIYKSYSHQHKKIQLLKLKINSQKRNIDYLIYLMRDLEDIAGYGKDNRYVVDLISKSLEDTFPYSTISSIFTLENRLIFKSTVKETVNTAFISRIKEEMINKLELSNESKLELEENISGAALDDLSTSTIKSSANIIISINFQPLVVINISSTKPDLYSEDDIKTFETISYLVSGFLSRIELLLKFEKSKSLAMIDSFSDGIFMVDMQKDLIAINDSALKLLKLNPIHPSLNDVLSALPNTYNFLDKIERCIRNNHQLTENEINLNGKILKIVLTPVQEIKAINSNQTIRQPNVIGASVLLHDITVEKSLTQMRDDFTNIMVHELRSPLTAIKASSEFLTSKAKFTDEEKAKLVQMISESSHRMLDKISLILDAAKMESGLFTIRKTDSDLKKLLEDRVAEFAQIAAKKSITFKNNIDPGIPVFAFDKTRIDEVVNNLLSNSLKFTPEHGTISLNAILSSDRVIVSVADDGEGIAKDKQDKLFSKYQQAPSTGDHVGTGLGLYVVKQVVENHGGTVSLDSNDGTGLPAGQTGLPAGRQGTTITFTLPLHPLAASLPKLTGQNTQNAQKMVN